MLTMLTTIFRVLLASAVTLSMFHLQGAVANDGAYYTSGNQLVPMHVTQIDVKKEVLDIRRDGDDIVVNVHYEMINNGAPVSLLVGFEAMPPDGGGVDRTPLTGEHPYMSDFSAQVNGRPVQYEVALVDTKEHWQLDADNQYSLNLDMLEPPFYFQDGHIKKLSQSTVENQYATDSYYFDGLYVYHFTANFASGRNVIDHSYRFNASHSVDASYSLNYMLTTINRWGDSTIDDFELTLDMGDLTQFNMPNTFFNSSDDWQIEGVGRVYLATDDSLGLDIGDNGTTTFAIRDGRAVFTKTDFTPQGNLFLTSPRIGINSQFDASKHNLSLNYMTINHVRHGAELDEFSYKVLRNYPFARRGYVFNNARLQAYYDRQPWYIADPSYHADFDGLDAFDREYIESLDDLR